MKIEDLAHLEKQQANEAIEKLVKTLEDKLGVNWKFAIKSQRMTVIDDCVGIPKTVLAKPLAPYAAIRFRTKEAGDKYLAYTPQLKHFVVVPENMELAL